MLTAIRELAEEAEAGGDLAAIVARGRRLRRADARDAARAAEAASSTPARPGWSRSCAGSPRRSPASRCRERRRSRARGRRSTRSTRSSRATATAPSSSSRATRLDADALERELEPLGDSLLVVGDPTRAQGARAHRRPGRALSLGVARGDDRGRRDREHAPADARARGAAAARRGRRRPRRRARVVAVAAGDGNRRLFESLGAQVVDGGRTMNPSTAEILAAIEAAAAAARSSCCRTTRNVDLARRAGRGARRRGRSRVVPTRSMQAGLAAWSRSTPRVDAADERRRDGRGGRRPSRPARSRSPRATSQLNGIAIRKGAVARPRRRRARSRAARRSTRSRARSSSGCSTSRAAS